MDPFSYRDGELFAEELPVAQLAERFGTPLYLYSRDALETHYRAFDDAFGEHPHRVCYAVKANSNLAVLQVLAQACAGFDIVSGGELERVLRAGARVLRTGPGGSLLGYCTEFDMSGHLVAVNAVAAKELLRAAEQQSATPPPRICVPVQEHPELVQWMLSRGWQLKKALLMMAHGPYTPPNEGAVFFPQC